MSERPRSMRFARRSRIIDPSEMEPIPDTEDMQWKRKYRQSLNDVDLANKFAEFLPAEFRDSFLDHNKSEFDTVLEARPRTASVDNTGATILPDDYLAAWQDLDMSGALTSRQSRRASKRFSQQLHPRTSTYITSLPPLPPPPSDFDMEQYRMRSDSIASPTSPAFSAAPGSETKEAPPRRRRDTVLRPMRSFVSFLRRL